MVKFANMTSLLLVGLTGSTARPVVGTGRTTAFAVGGSRAYGRSSVIMQAAADQKKLPVLAGEEVMSQKAHGTSEKPVMKNLRWGCDYETADRICNFNRHYAEYAGYWTTTNFLKEVERNGPTTYYDSVTGNPLFTAPVGRSMDEFLKESASHGWPSFRDEEVNWEYVRCLKNGECISTTGTHLGHNLPDSKGNRYCINLVSVAGQPKEE